MWVAFAFAKATHIFSAKIPVNLVLYLLEQLTFRPLTSSLSCFEQLGPDVIEFSGLLRLLGSYIIWVTSSEKVSLSMGKICRSRSSCICKNYHPGPSCSKRCKLNKLVKGHFINCFSRFNIQYCKSYSHFFSKKFQCICESVDVNFNKSLTNDIVSFEQLGPGIYSIVSNGSVCRQWRPWSVLAVQADLGLHCTHMPEDTFLHGVAHMYSWSSTQSYKGAWWMLHISITSHSTKLTLLCHFVLSTGEGEMGRRAIRWAEREKQRIWGKQWLTVQKQNTNMPPSPTYCK